MFNYKDWYKSWTKSKYVLSGIIIGSLLLGGTALAKSLDVKIPVRFANIQLIVNDEVIQTTAEPFIYQGNVYAPVATIANALSIDQRWDNDVPAVRFSKKNKEVPYEIIEGYPTKYRLGANVYLGAPKSFNYYDLVVIGKEVTKYTVPQVTKEGYGTLSFPTVKQFVNVTGKSEQEFLMKDKLVEDDGSHAEHWLTLFRFDGKDVLKVDSVKINLENNQYKTDVVYHEDSRKIYVSLYDENQKLVSVQVYQWQQDKLMEVDNLTK